MKNRFSSFAAAVVLLGLGTSYTGVQLASARPRSGSPEKTFVGEITRNSDNKNQRQKYILQDENGMKNYYLDDKGKAAKYVDRQVEIVGSLNHQATIRVHSIKALS